MGSDSFRPIQTHAPLPDVIANATTGGRHWKNLLSHSEIGWNYPGGSVHNSGTMCIVSISTWNAGYKIGILRRVTKPDHEPFFKASRPSYFWDNMHWVEIGRSQERKAWRSGWCRTPKTKRVQPVRTKGNCFLFWMPGYSAPPQLHHFIDCKRIHGLHSPHGLNPVFIAMSRSGKTAVQFLQS